MLCLFFEPRFCPMKHVQGRVTRFVWAVMLWLKDWKLVITMDRGEICKLHFLGIFIACILSHKLACH